MKERITGNININMPKTITLKNYQQFWMSDKPYGSDFVFWDDEVGKVTIKCKRKGMKRDKSNRLRKSWRSERV